MKGYLILRIFYSGVFNINVWNTSRMYGILVLYFGEKLNTPVPRVQLWRSVLSSQRMSVLSKDASLVKGCLVLSKVSKSCI